MSENHFPVLLVSPLKTLYFAIKKLFNCFCSKRKASKKGYIISFLIIFVASEKLRKMVVERAFPFVVWIHLRFMKKNMSQIHLENLFKISSEKGNLNYMRDVNFPP